MAPEDRPIIWLAGCALALGLGCGGVVVTDDSFDDRPLEDNDTDGSATVGSGLMCQRGQPSDACNECAERAIVGACSAERDICSDSAGQECTRFGQCQYECYADIDCCVGCAEQRPDGQQQQADLQRCSVCEECELECAGLFPELCNP